MPSTPLRALLALLSCALRDQPVVAQFSAAPISGVQPLTVVFQNLSSPHAVFWQWNFGDGNTSTAFEPVHVYVDAGEYSVTLVAGALPLSVQFGDDDPLGLAQAWNWNFGDDAISSQAAPLHVYWQPGSHDVSLTTSSGSASATTSVRGLVLVFVPSVLLPGLVALPRLGSAPLKVSLAYPGTGPEPESLLWDFGDGHTSTVRSPVHVYAEPGLHDVSVTASLGGVLGGGIRRWLWCRWARRCWGSGRRSRLLRRQVPIRVSWPTSRAMAWPTCWPSAATCSPCPVAETEAGARPCPAA